MAPAVEEQGSPPLRMRAVGFDELGQVLRLIRDAVEHGCRAHYNARQREAVCRSYATTLFIEARGTFEMLAAEQSGELVAFAQFDPQLGRLRGLFVEAALQRRGLGGALLAEVEARVRARGCLRLKGAMSLNAVPFYAKAGFRPLPHPVPGSDVMLTAGVSLPVVLMRKDLPS
jgi:GNAT superfamily N-acetyltransferase